MNVIGYNTCFYVYVFSRTNGYMAVATKAKYTHTVKRDGRHRFRLLCINDSLELFSTDNRWIKI